MKSVRKKSQEQENRIAKELNGGTTPGSGAVWHSKGDVKAENYLIEAKYTDEPYYSVALPILKKIENEALHENFRIPVLYVDIQEVRVCLVSEKYISKPDKFVPEHYSSTVSSSFRLHKGMCVDSLTKNIIKGVLSIKGNPFYIMAPEDLDYFCL